MEVQSCLYRETNESNLHGAAASGFLILVYSVLFFMNFLFVPSFYAFNADFSCDKKLH